MGTMKKEKCGVGDYVNDELFGYEELPFDVQDLLDENGITEDEWNSIAWQIACPHCGSHEIMYAGMDGDCNSMFRCVKCQNEHTPEDELLRTAELVLEQIAI